MSRFLSAEVIRASVQRLIESRAKAGFVSFLVLKRALVRAGSTEVSFSSRSEDFTEAMRELGATYPEGTPDTAPEDLQPFVKVFGTGSASKYITRKWETNGPADTLSGPSWKSVVNVRGQDPRRGALRPGYEAHLAPLLLKAEGQLPGLLDASIWYHRARDLEVLSETIQDSVELEQHLRDSFTAELGLTLNEIETLFDEEAQPLEDLPLDDVLSDEVADPREYLPDLQAPVEAVSGNLQDLLGALETRVNSPEVGLRFSRLLLLRFTAALGSKRFLILSGLAGSGKTKLAQAFARWMTPPPTEDGPPAYAVIPVGADWTSNENILGYPDGLDPRRYVVRPALDLIQRAARPDNAQVPHILILDEMNLSHVERYFADLLSLIESGEATELYRPAEGEEGEPQLREGAEPLLRLPPNLFIIGTVNVDETTYMFSPKVLDRANVIEFRVSRDDLLSFLEAPQSPRLEELNGHGSGFGADFVTTANSSLTVPESVREPFKAEMVLFFDLLKDHGAEFAFRVANEAARFLHLYQLLGGYTEGDAWFTEAMDAVIVQKFLPKLHGSRQKLEGLLWSLIRACGASRDGLSPEDFLAQCREAGQAQDEARYGPEAVAKALGDNAARYPLSFDKLMRMWRKLVRDQFVTFAEA